MDWFPPEPTLGWVRWQLDRLARVRLTAASADLEADYDLLGALEASLAEDNLTDLGDRGPRGASSLPGSCPPRPSRRGLRWRRTTPRRSPGGSSGTPSYIPSGERRGG